MKYKFQFMMALSLSAVLLLSGCGTSSSAESDNQEQESSVAETSESPSPSEADAETTESASDVSDAVDTASEDKDTVYADGTYVGAGEGYAGEIPVNVTIKDDIITDISLGEHGEDEIYMEEAMQVIDDILESQSTDVDTVSGATLSSNGIIAAVEDALEQAKN